jgi:hypothetical protein
MLFNAYFLEEYIQTRQKQLEATARLERLIQETKKEKPRLWQELTWHMGDWMIGLGYRLKREQVLTS